MPGSFLEASLRCPLNNFYSLFIVTPSPLLFLSHPSSPSIKEHFKIYDVKERAMG